MNIEYAKELLIKAARKMHNFEGTIYLVSLGEDEGKYYFEICDIPNDKRPSDPTRYAISPPWFVDKNTGEASINWGIAL